MISKTVEYALRTVVFLASQDGARTVQQIADQTRVRADYLAKVLQGLRRKGLVSGQRGVGGGYALTRPPAELTVWDVVEAVDPIQRILTCPLDLASHGVKLCPLHRRLDDALAGVEKAYRATTIAEVLAEPSDSKPLCDVSPGRVPLPPAGG